MCSNGEYLGDNGVSLPGKQWVSRRIYYCPQGARAIQLLFAGTYVFGQPPREVRETDPRQIDLSIETYVPPVWDPARPYAIGDQASGAVAANNRSATYVARAASLKNLPTASNTGAWTLTTPQPIPITCANVHPCTLGATTDANGASLADEFLVTDPLVVDIPPGSLIAIRAWIGQSGAQTFGQGPDQTQRGGSYESYAAVQPSLTAAGSRTAGGSSHNVGPFAIIGVQNVPVPAPSACIVGDSRLVGVAGMGLSSISLLNGGSGYSQRDVGRLAVLNNEGASKGNVLDPAVLVIQSVVADQVTAVGIYYPGHYADPVAGGVAGVASTLPSGAQTTRPVYGTAGGSGLMISIPPSGGFSGSPGIYEDPRTFAAGLGQKGLSDGGVPFAAFSRSSDLASTWASRDGAVERLAAIRMTGCTSVLIGLGINDVNSGQSVTDIQTSLLTLANNLLALGTVTKVYLLTMPPQATSNDFWATTAKQRAGSRDNVRAPLNDWARTIPAPFSGTFDIAGPLEVNAANVPTPGGGLWVVNGKPHYATMDRIHLAPSGHALAAKVISDNVWMLR